MAKDIESLKTRSMRDKIIFYNIPEKKDEDLKETVAVSMLKTCLDLSGVEYDHIHRLGVASTDGKPRGIMANHACMETHRDYRVTGKREINKKNDPWISPQFPDSVQEERTQLERIAEIAHKKDKKKQSVRLHTMLCT